MINKDEDWIVWSNKEGNAFSEWCNSSGRNMKRMPVWDRNARKVYWESEGRKVPDSKESEIPWLERILLNEAIGKVYLGMVEEKCTNYSDDYFQDGCNDLRKLVEVYVIEKKVSPRFFTFDHFRVDQFKYWWRIDLFGD